MISIFEDPAAVAAAAALRFARAARDAVARQGRFVVALPGGSTPRLLHRALAERTGLPWSATLFLFGDERCVPPDDEQSNYRMARETLFEPLRIAPGQLLRLHGEAADPAQAASEYEQALRALFPGAAAPRIDLLLLGMGEDGHTASLFPGTAALDETRRWVTTNYVPRLAEWRLTLTLPALCAAREILFLVTGASKARVAAEAFGGRPHEVQHPAERVVPPDGTREILLDRAAAQLL